MSFPSTSVLDNFNRADGAIGANWPDKPTSSYSPLTISSNQAAGSVGNNGSFWITSFAGDQEIFTDVPVIPSSAGNTFDIWARGTGLNGSGKLNAYMGQWAVTGTAMKLFKFVAGAATQLGTTVTQAMANGDGLGISCVGTTITLWYRSGPAGTWTSVIQVTDSAVSGAGQIGISSQGSSTMRFDNFGGGAPSGGGSPGFRFAFS